jgi:hypothetical protein
MNGRRQHRDHDQAQVGEAAGAEVAGGLVPLRSRPSSAGVMKITISGIWK